MRNAGGWVALVVALAGCAGTGETGRTDGPPSPDAPGGDASAGAPLLAARFPGVEASSEALYANGTLRLEQANRPPSAPAGSPAADSLVTVDVTKLVSRGVPAILVADVRSQMTRGNVYVWFSIPNDDFRNGAFGPSAGGAQHVEQGLVRVSGEPITLNLYYDEAEPAREVPYVLSARLAFDPEVVPGAFPVGLTLPEGSRNIDVELVGERRDFAFDLEVPNLMLWGPDDAFLGHHALPTARTTIQLPADAKGGEYVLLLSQGGRAMRVHAAGAQPAALRALPQSFVLSGEHSGGTPQKAEWTTTYDRVPVLAGIVFTPTSVSASLHVKLDGPAGTLMDGTADGPFFNTPPVPVVGGLSSGGWWDSAYGVPGLAAGSYRGLVEAPQSAGADPVRARDVAAFWSR